MKLRLILVAAALLAGCATNPAGPTPHIEITYPTDGAVYEGSNGLPPFIVWDASSEIPQLDLVAIYWREDGEPWLLIAQPHVSVGSWFWWECPGVTTEPGTYSMRAEWPAGAPPWEVRAADVVTFRIGEFSTAP